MELDTTPTCHGYSLGVVAWPPTILCILVFFCPHSQVGGCADVDDVGCGVGCGVDNGVDAVGTSDVDPTTSLLNRMHLSIIWFNLKLS